MAITGMDSEFIPSARFSAASFFGSLAKHHLSEMETLVARETFLKPEEADDGGWELSTLSDKIQASAVSTIVFAGMTVEAYIYDYSARYLGRTFTDDHVDKMSLESRWVVVPKLITGRDFPKGTQGFELLKKLIRSRNRLIHYKSRQIRISDLTSEAIAARDDELRQDASAAVQAFHLLAADIEELHPDEIAKFHMGVNEHRA